MKKVILGLLTLSAFGFVSFPASADNADQPAASASGDNAIIQRVEMESDQYGTGNSVDMRGTVENRVRGTNGTGSNGVVQTGRTGAWQTGEDNSATSSFEIRNEINTDVNRGRSGGRNRR
jgi:hypothetical protein